MTTHLLRIFAALLLVAAIARSETEIYFAEDVSPWPPLINDVPRQPATKCLSMAATFRSRLTGVTTETFESFSDGNTPTTLNFGTQTATLTGYRLIWAITDPTGTRSGDFPSSGTKVLILYPGDNPTAGTVFTAITFSTPQSAFGFFATDIEANQFSIVLTNSLGVKRTIPVPVTLPQSSGGACYFGVIDRTDPFVTVEFVNTGTQPDGFAFDDMTIGTPAQVIGADAATLALNSYPGITITGTVGAHYRLQYTLDLASPTWITLEDILLPSSPYLYFDTIPISQTPKRFYRAFPLQ